MKASNIKKLSKLQSASILSLFTSSSTLICCAIPSLLVALGAGAALSSAISVVPQLVWFSEHKNAIFISAALMLAVSGYMQWSASKLPCPIDPILANACNRARVMARKIYYLSIMIYLIGGFFAFIAPLLNQL